MSGSFGQSIADLSQIKSVTKPIARINGSPLVVGDKWYDTDYRDWIWNGTYWLCRQSSVGFGYANSVANPVGFAFTFPTNLGIFFHTASYAVLLGNNDSSNYYIVSPLLQFTIPPNSGTGTTLTNFSTQGQPANSFYRMTNILNLAYPYLDSLIVWDLYYSALTTVGVPTITGHARFTLDYSLIAN